MKSLIILLMFMFACGTSDRTVVNRTDKDSKKQLAFLQDQIATLLESDFKTCSGIGETSDLIVKNICKIAQAATNETRSELINMLGQVVNDLQKQINSANTDLSSVYSQIETINTQLSALQAINNSGYFVVEIGSELVSAGPVRETLLVKQDRTLVNGYVDFKSTQVALSNNGITAASGSSTVTVTKPTTTVTVSVASPGVVTWNAHGFSNNNPVMFTTSGALPIGLAINTIYYVKNKTANTFELTSTLSGTSINTSGVQSGTHTGSLGIVAGDLVELQVVKAGKGFTGADLSKEHRVVSATGSSFTLTLNRNASSSGALGGNEMVLSKVVGRGMSTVWQVASGTDLAVRSTSTSTRAYNFIIKMDSSKAYVCYDTTNADALFATINAATTFPGVTGNIRCK